MSDIENLIGGKITETRLLRKMTQAQLAEEINVSVETISRMERGRTFPSLKTIAKISNALNVSIKDFFDFGSNKVKDKVYEREISKINAFLRTLNRTQISVAHNILKDVFGRLMKG